MSSIDFGYTPILVDHVAQQLHDRYCFMHRPQRGFTDPVPHGECLALDDHAWIREAGFLIASMLPKMGELFDVIRADERARVGDAAYGCTFDCSHCHQDCEEWGCRQHGPATTP